MTFRVALVGLSGSGKTSVGRALARAVSVPFLDLDTVIEETAGASVAKIFARRGEEGFRTLEAQALARVSAERGPMVLSSGGGVVLRPENRTLLRREYTVIWLDATPAILADRLRGVTDRPLLGEDPAHDLMQMFEEREMFYAETAHHRLESSHETTEAGQVRRIQTLLEQASET